MGPELAHLARVYLRSPRALVWQHPSSDWRVFVLLPPLASRLSLMRNPVFAQLTRSWGLAVRFVGVDRDGLVHDFRALLTDRTLALLVELLEVDLADDDALLDTLFAALAREMLTLLAERGPGWGRHLDVEHRLEPEVPGTLFERNARFPDFLGKLREALRDEIIDVTFYGRALRSIDLREHSVEQRAAAIIESTLDGPTLAKLARAGVRRHLGCYNWLRLGPRHAPARSHLLARLPALATFFAETLVPIDAGALDGTPLTPSDDERADQYRAMPTLDLRSLMATPASPRRAHWDGVLRRAIDAGQDRAVIEALSGRFGVSENIIRRLWREPPRTIGEPPTWHLAEILRRLDHLGERSWPADETQWRELAARAVPA